MNPIIESMNHYASANRWAIDGGPVQGLSSGQLEFPLIWHEPLALTGKIGRNEGYLTYKLSFLLLERRENGHVLQREAIREKLERHALGLVRTLENHERVRDVRLVSCLPAEAAMTDYGETAMTVSLEVDTFFCYPAAQA